jgi:predicted RNA binding protein YcfA (HicA-like mRNA interferase family)
VRPKRLLTRLREGALDNVRFSDFVALAEALGFELRRERGSHRIYKHPDLRESLNVQPLRNGDAKPYQLRKLLALCDEYSLDL